MDLRALVQDDGAEGRVLISCESTETNAEDSSSIEKQSSGSWPTDWNANMNAHLREPLTTILFQDE